MTNEKGLIDIHKYAIEKKLSGYKCRLDLVSKLSLQFCKSVEKEFD